jgi:hypothetical protein
MVIKKMDEYLNRLSDPKVFGPGKWDTIHDLAIRAKTPAQKEAFIESMQTICEKLKCQNCQKHCLTYLQTHSPKNFLHIKSSTGEDIGMFKWSWMFHNAVNARLHKPIVDWDTAYNLYSDTQAMICTKDCGAEEDSSPPSVNASNLPKKTPAASNTAISNTVTPTQDRILRLSRKNPRLVQVVRSSSIRSSTSSRLNTSSRSSLFEPFNS